MKSDYEERKAARIARLKARAIKKADEADSVRGRARDMASVIPMGQPILVGHHSEKRDRNYRKRINRLDEKGYNLNKEAASLADRAEAAENNNAISSDDPSAIEKLREKLAGMKAVQAKMVAFNKAMRKKDSAKMVELVGEKAMNNLLEPDFAGRVGFAGYMLSNNNGNMGNVKKRIAKLEALEGVSDSEIDFGDIRLVEAVSENRVQIFFPGKPSDEVRQSLKSNGFRWARSIGAWQRHYSRHAVHVAKQVIAEAQE